MSSAEQCGDGVAAAKGAPMNTMHDGGRLVELSVREREVLQQLVNGHGPARFAEHLYISRNTARTHVKHVLSKLGAHSCLEAVSIAVSEGMRPDHMGLSSFGGGLRSREVISQPRP
ncbi:MAG: helix-turn-helix transcriptional regulator [Acidimicrobiia bacterium]|nr:helix-turn-helix transcriptional regulator [Acidimicrobiia bacterium]